MQVFTVLNSGVKLGEGGGMEWDNLGKKKDFCFPNSGIVFISLMDEIWKGVGNLSIIFTSLHLLLYCFEKGCVWNTKVQSILLKYFA